MATDGVRRHLRSPIHELMSSHLTRLGHGRALLEVGCGSSTMLPYFAKEFGCVVSGIDYSDEGCSRSRRILDSAGVEGSIVRHDLFDPSPLHGQFDVVFSNGLVEHFDSTTGVLSAIRRFAKPGGLVLTMVPNLVGTIGLAQQLIDKTVYDLHVPLDRETLESSSTACGLRVVASGYIGSNNFMVCNSSKSSGFEGFWRNGLIRSLLLGSAAIWGFEAVSGIRLHNRWLASYVYCFSIVADQ